VRLLAAILLSLALIPVALASMEVQEIGPYTVSFNMNTDIPYQIQTQAPMTYPFGTIYPLVISTDNTTGASIGITQYNNLTTSTLDVNEEIAALRMALSGFNASAPEKMIIDNMSGFLVSGIPFEDMGNAPTGITLFQAQYWLDSKSCECGPVYVGTVLVSITSTYPKDVTQGLLCSIHVSSSQMTSPTAMSQHADYLSLDMSQNPTSSADVSGGDWLRPDRSMVEPAQPSPLAVAPATTSASYPQYPAASPAGSSLSNVTATVVYSGAGIFQVYVDGAYVGTGMGGSLTFNVKAGTSHVISIWDGFWSYEKEIYFESGLPKIINVEAV
jgi:hypothetical protein